MNELTKEELKLISHARSHAFSKYQNILEKKGLDENMSPAERKGQFVTCLRRELQNLESDFESPEKFKYYKNALLNVDNWDSVNVVGDNLLKVIYPTWKKIPQSYDIPTAKESKNTSNTGSYSGSGSYSYTPYVYKKYEPEPILWATVHPDVLEKEKKAESEEIVEAEVIEPV